MGPFCLMRTELLTILFWHIIFQCPLGFLKISLNELKNRESKTYKRKPESAAYVKCKKYFTFCNVLKVF